MPLSLGSSPGEGRDDCTTTVGFQAPAANKTLCQGTFALSALGERDRVPVVLPRGEQRLGEMGAMAPTLPRAVPPFLSKQISPCCCSLFSSVLPGSATAAQAAPRCQGQGSQPVLGEMLGASPLPRGQ